jgi:CBS domain-containing protein
MRVGDVMTRTLVTTPTETSVREAQARLDRLTVGEIMTKAVITVGPRREIGAAAVLMLEHKIGALPVLEDGRLAGIVTETDLLRALAAAG